MRLGTTAGLLAAALVLAAPTQAQRFGHPPPLGDNSRLMATEPNGANGNYFDQGMQALQARNYPLAEGIFDDVLRQNRNHADANFLMGVAKMGLDKWDEAKKYLEIAVRKSPKRPDPRSRLGVTLIKLGDIEGAKQQREELVKLQAACKGGCRDGQYINDGIAMIDGAMPKP
jgi:TolA-binding protein